MKNMRKRDNTYYADFRTVNGTRIRKSLGKDKAQAKIKLLQLMADPDVQSITAEDKTIQSSNISFKQTLNDSIKSKYKIEDTWTKQYWDQYSER